MCFQVEDGGIDLGGRVPGRSNAWAIGQWPVHDIHAMILHLLGLNHEELISATTAATNA